MRPWPAQTSREAFFAAVKSDRIDLTALS